MQPMPAFQQHMIKSHFLSSISEEGKSSYPLAEMMHWKLHMYI